MEPSELRKGMFATSIVSAKASWRRYLITASAIPVPVRNDLLATGMVFIT